jgi:BASS family bile acid:Na+ symporter
LIDIPNLTFKLSVLVFVIGSMFSMGLSLTMRQVMDPLKNVRLVLFSVIANFLLIPLLIFGIIAVIPLPESEKTGLVLLLMVVTIFYLPVAGGMGKGNELIMI